MRAPLLVGVLLLAGCSPQLSVDTYPTQPDTSLNCKALFADGPAQVAGQDDVLVDGGNALAWGDPPIIMRCGVAKPEALTATSQCNAVAGIDWLSEKTADGYLFTTIGLEFHVSVEVPADYDPAADALVDVADAVLKHDPVVKPCQG